MDARVIQAAPGSWVAPRQRPVGRIGGASGAISPQARVALAEALGPRASLLIPNAVPSHGDELDRAELLDRADGSSHLVVEFDACQSDGQALTRASDFETRLTPAGLASIEGAFALAWIAPDGALHLARDPIGERSLYYARVADGYVFASTLRALLTAGLVPRCVDRVGVAEYLSYAYVPGTRTLVEGVRAVLPGEILRLDPREGVSSTRYWSPPGDAEVLPISAEAEMRVDLRARLEAAVLRRLPPAGEPVGASLSGGLDSSLIVALAQRLAGRAIHTFSISFGPGYPNELTYSSMVAEHCGTTHTILELPPEAIVHHIDDVAAAFDRPVGDPLTVPNALLFREVAGHVGMLLNGEGGDPCFGGPKNLPMILAELYGDARNPPGDPFARERTFLRAHQKCYDDLPTLLDANARAAISGDVLERTVVPLFGDDRFRTFINKLMMMNLILKAGHHILPKVDSLSGTFGVLGRSPLLDRRVVESAFTMPPQLKLRGAEEKYLLKRAVDDLLPEPILTRPKSGMMVPVESWFSGPLHDHARARLLDGLPRFELFERRYLEDLVGAGLPNLRQRRGPKIWLLITLEAWLRRVLDAPAQNS